MPQSSYSQFNLHAGGHSHLSPTDQHTTADMMLASGSAYTGAGPGVDPWVPAKPVEPSFSNDAAVLESVARLVLGERLGGPSSPSSPVSDLHTHTHTALLHAATPPTGSICACAPLPAPTPPSVGCDETAVPPREGGDSRCVRTGTVGSDLRNHPRGTAAKHCVLHCRTSRAGRVGGHGIGPLAPTTDALVGQERNARFLLVL